MNIRTYLIRLAVLLPIFAATAVVASEESQKLAVYKKWAANPLFEGHYGERETKAYVARYTKRYEALSETQKTTVEKTHTNFIKNYTQVKEHYDAIFMPPAKAAKQGWKVGAVIGGGLSTAIAITFVLRNWKNRELFGGWYNFVKPAILYTWLCGSLGAANGGLFGALANRFILKPLDRVVKGPNILKDVEAFKKCHKLDDLQSK